MAASMRASNSSISSMNARGLLVSGQWSRARFRNGSVSFSSTLSEVCPRSYAARNWTATASMAASRTTPPGGMALTTSASARAASMVAQSSESIRLSGLPGRCGGSFDRVWLSGSPAPKPFYDHWRAGSADVQFQRPVVQVGHVEDEHPLDAQLVAAAVAVDGNHAPSSGSASKFGSLLPASPCVRTVGGSVGAY